MQEALPCMPAACRLMREHACHAGGTAMHAGSMLSDA